jgi:hypothetical protein
MPEILSAGGPVGEEALGAAFHDREQDAFLGSRSRRGSSSFPSARCDESGTGAFASAARAWSKRLTYRELQDDVRNEIASAAKALQTPTLGRALPRA